MRPAAAFCVISAFSVLLCSPAEAEGPFGPLQGHSIRVDGSSTDWKGTPSAKPDTGVISKGEFIWTDKYDDDTGNGKYVYPTNAAFTKAADLEEFRVTWDSRNVYFLIKTARPGDWWSPFRVIAIDTDSASGGRKGVQVIQQGDNDSLNADTGTFINLKVGQSLAVDYVISIAGTYKGRIWDSSGKLIAKTVGEKSTDTPGFKVKDEGANVIEIQVPHKIMGSPQGRSWRFIVACGLEDKEHAREVRKTGDEWRGGGGADNGVNPYVYDIASPDTATQEKELGSYNANGRARDPKAYATLEKSFLQVKFSPLLNTGKK